MRTAIPGGIGIAFKGQLGSFSLDAQFSVPAKGVAAIFGQSGCGKTPVARCIAGLVRLPDGRMPRIRLLDSDNRTSQSKWHIACFAGGGIVTPRAK
ncbi:ATP-binding cassette domain-containing protein [Bradyrhizobium sp. BWA-3-5]|uniref:ATP-binding cassette domain-containing protein n=1 Tax=Bradyrhizobium sp. BWA-3-5 TaxID=3080013 RepID=UPI00397920A6